MIDQWTPVGQVPQGADRLAQGMDLLKVMSFSGACANPAAPKSFVVKVFALTSGRHWFANVRRIFCNLY